VSGGIIGGTVLLLDEPGIGGSLLCAVLVGVAVPPVVAVVVGSSLVLIGGIIGTAVAALSFFLSPHAAVPSAANINTRRTSAGPPGGGVGRGMSSSRWTICPWDAPAAALSSAHTPWPADGSSGPRLQPRAPGPRNSSAEGTRSGLLRAG
jgi:hypothetical protein